MKDPKQAVSQSRRKFLRDAGVAGGAAAIAATAPGSVAAQVPDSAEAPREEGYRLTQHILDYYKSAAS